MIFLVFLYLCVLIFSGFLQLKGNFVRGQNPAIEALFMTAPYQLQKIIVNDDPTTRSSHFQPLSLSINLNYKPTFILYNFIFVTIPVLSYDVHAFTQVEDNQNFLILMGY